MNISLDATLDKFVIDQLATGEFASPDAVVDAALRLMMERETLRRDIAIGVEQADRGDFVDGAEAFDRIRRKHAERFTETKA